MIDVNHGVFHPHEWQGEILLSRFRRKVVLCGRQSGKTTLLKTIIYNASLSVPNQEILVLAPTHGQVKELLWRPFTRLDHPLFHPSMVKHQNNSDMTIELFNNSRVTFKGTENLDALLGREVNLICFDEWQSHKPEVWTYMEPLLATRSGTAIFTGTARRGNHIMDFYNYHLEREMWAGWKITTPMSGSPAGQPENIELAKQSMSKEQFEQEYLCEPMNTEGLVYPGFCDDNKIDNNEAETYATLANIPLHIGLDFNISVMCATVSVNINGVIYFVDEIIQKFQNANTATMIAEIKRRYSGRNFIIYPDATGRNRTTNTIDPNNTNHAMLRQAGFNLVYSNSGNPPIEDRNILINGMIKPMVGEPKFYVSKKCVTLIESLEKQSYKNGKPDKTSGFDHALDCMAYTMWHNYANTNQITQRGIYNKSSGNLVKDLVNGTI